MSVFIEIGSLKIPTYGVCALLGILLGVFVIWRTRHYRKLPNFDVMMAVLFAIVGAVVGARLLYIIVELPHYLQSENPLQELLFGGGIVFYGGVIGGAAGGFWYTHKYKIAFFDFFDVVAPSLALGHAIGRVGCFMAGCCYGMEVHSDCPIAVVFPENSFAPSGVPLLPTQLMEAAFLLLLGVALLLVLRRSTRRGFVAALYMIGYGAWRFVLEFFRSDPRGSVGALSTSQFISLFIVAAGIVVLFGRRLLPRYFDKGEK